MAPALIAILPTALAALLVSGCNSGSAGSSGGSGGMGGSDGTRSLCESGSCDDGNACTTDTCDPADGSCTSEPILADECRVQITVDFPARAATLIGDGTDPTVTVTGTVGSELGEVTELTINDAAVTVAADGKFSHEVDAQVGGNTLVLSATDAQDNVYTWVQSFLWSTGYLKPTTPKEGIAPHALGLWLSQAALDDGKTSPPADFAEILERVLESVDGSTLFDPNTPVTSQAGFDVYLTMLRLGDAAVALTAIDGGLHLQASFPSITGDLFFDCTNLTCESLGGDSLGNFELTEAVVDVFVLLTVTPEHTLSVDVQSVARAANLNVSTDNDSLNALLGSILPLLLSTVTDELSGGLAGVVGPMLKDALGALAFRIAVEVPSLSGGAPFIVDLVTDFDSTDFHNGAAPPDPSPPAGGALRERAGAYTPESATPYDNLGIPNRDGCGQGGMSLPLPRQAAIELGLSDDLLNQVLYAAWRGGALEVEVGPELLGDIDFTVLGIENLQMQVSGMLAPTVSDCDDGALRVHVGDLRIDASMQFDGSDLTLTAFISLGSEVQLSMTGEGVGIAVGEIDEFDAELTINEPEQRDNEDLIQGLLAVALVDAIEGALGDGGLASIPLPEIDLSAALDLPPGSAVIELMLDTVTHNDGVTVVSGTL